MSIVLSRPVSSTSVVSGFRDEPPAVNPALLYLAELGSKQGRRTMRSKLNRLARLAGATCLEDCNWGGMRHHDVHALVLMLERENLEASTVNNYLSALKGVATQAWKEGLMDSETLQRIRSIKSRRSSRLPTGRCLSMKETGDLLNCHRGVEPVVDVRDRAVLALMIGCGLRRAELCGLTLDEYDPSDASITLVGKGNKERKVYVPEAADELLQEWIHLRGTREGYLFTRIYRGGHLMVDRPLSESGVTLILNQRIRIAGAKAATPHDLRRTFATRLIEDGHDLVKVQRAMGHSNVQTTARYDRRSEKDQKEMARSVRL